MKTKSIKVTDLENVEISDKVKVRIAMDLIHEFSQHYIYDRRALYTTYLIEWLLRRRNEQEEQDEKPTKWDRFCNYIKHIDWFWDTFLKNLFNSLFRR